MKKILLVSLIALTLTGCGKKNMLCTFENKEEGLKVKSEMKVEFKGNKVKNATVTMTYENESDAENMCKIFGLASDSSDKVECNGNVIVIKDYQNFINNGEEISKKDFLEYAEDSKYTCE